MILILSHRIQFRERTVVQPLFYEAMRILFVSTIQEGEE